MLLGSVVVTWRHGLGSFLYVAGSGRRWFALVSVGFSVVLVCFSLCVLSWVGSVVDEVELLDE